MPFQLSRMVELVITAWAVSQSTMPSHLLPSMIKSVIVVTLSPSIRMPPSPPADPEPVTLIPDRVTLPASILTTVPLSPPSITVSSGPAPISLRPFSITKCSWKVPTAILISSPDWAASIATWIDSPGCTVTLHLG